MTEEQERALEVLSEFVSSPEFIKSQREKMHIDAVKMEKLIEQNWLNGSWQSRHI